MSINGETNSGFGEFSDDPNHDAVLLYEFMRGIATTSHVLQADIVERCEALGQYMAREAGIHALHKRIVDSLDPRKARFDEEVTVPDDGRWPFRDVYYGVIGLSRRTSVQPIGRHYYTHEGVRAGYVPHMAVYACSKTAVARSDDVELTCMFGAVDAIILAKHRAGSKTLADDPEWQYLQEVFLYSPPRNPQWQELMTHQKQYGRQLGRVALVQHVSTFGGFIPPSAV